MLETYEEIVSNINRRFGFKVACYKTTIYGKKELYLEIFREKLFCEKFCILTEEVKNLFNEVTILHCGASVDEIHNWVNKMARNNIDRLKNKEIKDELTEEQRKSVIEYHKYLFTDTKINENPFDMDV